MAAWRASAKLPCPGATAGSAPAEAAAAPLALLHSCWQTVHALTPVAMNASAATPCMRQGVSCPPAQVEQLQGLAEAGAPVPRIC